MTMRAGWVLVDNEITDDLRHLIKRLNASSTDFFAVVGPPGETVNITTGS